MIIWLKKDPCAENTVHVCLQTIFQKTMFKQAQYIYNNITIV